MTVWLNSQSPRSLSLCTPVLAELHYGVERLPKRRRRDRLQAWVDRLENDLYRDRILMFDTATAAEFGRLAARRASHGRRMEAMDALIAGTAACDGASLATRDISELRDLGLELINPFDPASVDRSALKATSCHCA